MFSSCENSAISARARQKGPPLPPSPSRRPPKTQGEGRREGDGERGSRNLCSGRLMSMWRLLRLQHDSVTTSLNHRNSQKHGENNLKRLLARYLTHTFFGGGDFLGVGFSTQMPCGKHVGVFAATVYVPLWASGSEAVTRCHLALMSLGPCSGGKTKRP